MRASIAAVRTSVCLFAFAQMASLAAAQGLLVNTDDQHPQRLPRTTIIVAPPHAPPPASYKIDAIEVNAQLKGQLAQVQLSQTFVNTGSATLEASLVFPLPYDGAIDQWTLMVDGKELPGRMLTKEEARSQYEAIVRRNRDPALLEWLGHGMFQTSVFPLPPGAERKVTLRYSQICRVEHGLTEFAFPLSTARYTDKPVSRVKIEVAIEADRKIQNLYSPSHDVKFDRHGRRAVARYEGKNEVPALDFRLMYDIGDKPLGAKVVSYRDSDKDEGYFLLLASPEIVDDNRKPMPKTVVLVVDRSGSMSGAKIDQAKGAARFVVNNLREGDLFNIVAYDSAIASFRPELQKYDSETREAALGFIDGLFSGGSTNIDGALATALAQLRDSSRPNYVLFLTDGLPTVGEQNEMKIVANAHKNNQVRARVISFGVGYDVNSRLLDRLARNNHGQSVYVRPDEDIETSVARLYDKIKAPVLTDVKVAVELKGKRDKSAAPLVNRLYPRGPLDLFAGEQLVIAGRYRRGGEATVRVTGQLNGKDQEFEFPVELVERSGDESAAFVARVWATRRIGEIIDELDLKGQNPELVNELVELSKRYGVLTPYTSFLADETKDLNQLTDLRIEAREKLRELETVSGVSGNSQRAAKGGQMNAMNAAPAASLAPGQADVLSRSQTNAYYLDARTDQVVVCQTVQQLGAKSFYRRASGWLDSTVSAEQEKAAKRIEQFSPEFFELVARQKSDAGAYFTLDEAVTLNLGDDTYRIEPAKR